MTPHGIHLSFFFFSFFLLEHTWDFEQLVLVTKHSFCGPCDDWPDGLVLHVALGSKTLQLLLKTYCTTDHLQLSDHH